MKEQIKDANFPKTSDGRVYHLSIRAGELASRIITVGDPARARVIAKYLDSPPSNAAISEYEADASDAHIATSKDIVKNPALFELYSDRGFLTLTGTYKGIPVSIVSIGMGAPNMDFFVREGREVLDEAGEEEMVVIRFGSCGGIIPSLPVGSLVVPKASLAVTRNYDFNFRSTAARTTPESAYHVSKPAVADEGLHSLLVSTLKESLPSQVMINDSHLNASADSFYSTQGRITSFPDHNEWLIDTLVEKGVGSLEMETFHLLHLSNSWPRAEGYSGALQKPDGIPPVPPTGMPAESLIFPSSTLPVSDARIFNGSGIDEQNEDAEQEETILYPVSTTRQSSQMNSNRATPPESPIYAAPTSPVADSQSKSRIRAAAVQMIFAERTSRAFISPEEVETLQEGAAKGLLETLIRWRQGESSEAEGENV